MTADNSTTMKYVNSTIPKGVWPASARRLGEAGGLLGGLMKDNEFCIVDRSLWTISSLLATVISVKGGDLHDDARQKQL